MRLLVPFFCNSLFWKFQWVSLVLFVPNALSKISIRLTTKLKKHLVLEYIFGIFYSIKNLHKYFFSLSITTLAKACNVSIVLFFSLWNISFWSLKSNNLLLMPYKSPGLLQHEYIEEHLIVPIISFLRLKAHDSLVGGVQFRIYWNSSINFTMVSLPLLYFSRNETLIYL